MTIKDYGVYLQYNSVMQLHTGCWVWQKTKTKFGYGMATRKDTGNSGLAHRESYKHFKGPIPHNLKVLHRCDNPSCVNPEHLFLGTQKDNMQDMKTKLRSPNRQGENNTTAKLTVPDVTEIRNFVPEKWGDLTKLAIKMNVTKTTISDIRNNRTWK